MAEKNALKIAVLGTRGIPDVQGGVERHCESLYPLLVKRGCLVRVYTRRPYGNPSPGYFDGVERVPLWAPRIKSLEAIVHTFLGLLHLLISPGRFDIVHIHSIGPSVLVPLARLTGSRIVVTNHGPDYERQKWGGFAKRVLLLGERVGTRYAHAVIAVARHIQEMLERTYRRKVNYIPNGIPDLRRQPAGEQMRRFRLVEGQYVLAVGRFVPEKGFQDLLKAFEGLDTSWHLVLTGRADHDDPFSRSLVQRANTDNRVVLTGELRGRDLEEIYSNAGLFVLPSYHEGLPLTLLEALSYGLPVIASDINANREIISDRATMFLPGDVDSLRRLLTVKLRLFGNGTHTRKVDKAILAEFDWARIADKTLSVYQGIFS